MTQGVLLDIIPTTTTQEAHDTMSTGVLTDITPRLEVSDEALADPADRAEQVDDTPTDEDDLPRFEDLDGHQLLHHPSTLRASARLRLLAAVAPVEEALTETDRLIALADLVDHVSATHAKRQAVFDTWTATAGIEAATTLVIAYVRAVGEGTSSPRS